MYIRDLMKLSEQQFVGTIARFELSHTHTHKIKADENTNLFEIMMRKHSQVKREKKIYATTTNYTKSTKTDEKHEFFDSK